jgi:hypothetical protein
MGELINCTLMEENMIEEPGNETQMGNILIFKIE